MRFIEEPGVDKPASAPAFGRIHQTIEIQVLLPLRDGSADRFIKKEIETGVVVSGRGMIDAYKGDMSFRAAAQLNADAM